MGFQLILSSLSRFRDGSTSSRTCGSRPVAAKRYEEFSCLQRLELLEDRTFVLWVRGIKRTELGSEYCFDLEWFACHFPRWKRNAVWGKLRRIPQCQPRRRATDGPNCDLKVSSLASPTRVGMFQVQILGLDKGRFLPNKQLSMIKAYAFWFIGRRIGGFAPHMWGWKSRLFGAVD